MTETNHFQSDGSTVEGGKGGNLDLDKIESHEHLRNALTNTMTLSPEAFERLYLGPKTEVKGDLRKTFANPTPMAVMGFSVAVLPISAALSKRLLPAMYTCTLEKHAFG
jgi:hypothetical protein